jgi:1-acyl-sn-glycerol-3-phosphate acyltransferase
MLGPLGTAFSLSFTLAMSEAAIASSWLDPSGETTRRLGRFWGTTLCRACGIHVDVRGGQGVDWTRPVIIMANHQSYVDIPVLYATLPEPFGMLAKRELYRFPVFRAAMKGMRCIPIDRQNKRQSFESLRKAAEQVHQGNSIVVFPEGTRSPDGCIHDLKKGPFYLAELAAVPIVPVGISGTRGSLPRGSMLVRSADVTVVIGDPICNERKGADARERVRYEVRSALLALSGLPPAAASQGAVAAGFIEARG